MSITQKQVDLNNQTRGYKVSEKYVPINTGNVLKELEGIGFKPRSFQMARVSSKNTEKQGFQKHLYRLNHDSLTLKSVGETRPELILVNSYDKSSSLQFRIGLYRLVCANGLVLGSDFGVFRIRHLGNVRQGINEAFQFIQNALPKIERQLGQLQARDVTPSEQVELVNSSLHLLNLPENTDSVSISQVLQPVRQGDTTNNAWTILNRIQEAYLRRGVRYLIQTTNNQGQLVLENRRTREVKSIDRSIELNQALFDHVTKFFGIGAA